jgi:hypothetical protein
MSPELNNEMTRRRKCQTCFSGAFAKLRKENSGFVMSVCLSALEETSHRTNFHEI